MNTEKFSLWLQTAARKIGAHSVACIRMDNPVLRQELEKNNERVGQWLRDGLHGEMDYLERMFTEKADPWNAFPFARSVVVLTFTNGWGDPAATHPFPVQVDQSRMPEGVAPGQFTISCRSCQILKKHFTRAIPKCRNRGAGASFAGQKLDRTDICRQ